MPKGASRQEVERRVRIAEALIIQGRATDLEGLKQGLEEAGIVVSVKTAIRYAEQARKRLTTADDELRVARREILTRKVLALDASIAAGISKHNVIPTYADRIACLKLLRDILGIESSPTAKPAVDPAEFELEKKNEKELDDLLVGMLRKSASMLECTGVEAGKESEK